MDKFLDSALDILKDVVDKQFNGNVSAASRFLGASTPTFHAWLRGDRKPALSVISPLLEKLGAKITLPSQFDNIQNFRLIKDSDLYLDDSQRQHELDFCQNLIAVKLGPNSETVFTAFSTKYVNEPI